MQLPAPCQGRSRLSEVFRGYQPEGGYRGRVIHHTQVVALDIEPHNPEQPVGLGTGEEIAYLSSPDGGGDAGFGNELRPDVR